MLEFPSQAIPPGLRVPNLVVVKVGADGKIDLYNPAGSTDIVIDVVGWSG